MIKQFIFFKLNNQRSLRNVRGPAFILDLISATGLLVLRRVWTEATAPYAAALSSARRGEVPRYATPSASYRRNKVISEVGTPSLKALLFCPSSMQIWKNFLFPAVSAIGVFRTLKASTSTSQTCRMFLLKNEWTKHPKVGMNDWQEDLVYKHNRMKGACFQNKRTSQTNAPCTGTGGEHIYGHRDI